MARLTDSTSRALESPLGGVDALLLLSFGGPEGEEDVVPFLENVTRGRGIPRERLKEVGKHYFYFDGVSPLNRLNLEIIDNLKAELSHRGYDIPVYFGNRNWHPFGADTAAQMSDDGVRNALVFATSAWGGYSGCRQYDDDITAIIEQLDKAGKDKITFTKLPHFYSHPDFIAGMAKVARHAVAAATAEAEASGGVAKVLFTAHSIPSVADTAAGGPEDAHLYSRQVAEASALIAEAAGIKEYENVWQSRSGDPATPWLEPDVVDRATELHEEGITHLAVIPVGFISDHMEVIWDLDTDLKTACDEMGMTVHRAETIGHTPEFARMIIDIAEAVATGEHVPSLGSVTVGGCTTDGSPCTAGCCQARRPNSAKA